MQLTRRAFLKSMFAGAGVVIAAPAIVRASSLMKLYVPPAELVLPSLGPALSYKGSSSFSRGDGFPNASYSTIGDMYYNTHDQHVHIYDGSTWIRLEHPPFKKVS